MDFSDDWAILGWRPRQPRPERSAVAAVVGFYTEGVRVAPFFLLPPQTDPTYSIILQVERGARIDEQRTFCFCTVYTQQLNLVLPPDSSVTLNITLHGLGERYEAWVRKMNVDRATRLDHLPPDAL